jgi:hypothetical protein
VTLWGKNSGQMFQLALLLLKDEHAAEAVLPKGLDDLAFERAPQYSDIKSWEHAVLEQSIKLLYLPAGGGGQFG